MSASFRFLLLQAGAIALLAACKPDKKDDPAPPPAVVAKSVYVVNEGTSNGAISLFDKPSKALQRDLFEPANGRKLGPFVQSMTLAGNQAYIVVNGGNEIEVVNVETFAAAPPIRNLSQPRYLVVSNSKAYVTEWLGTFPAYSAGRVSVISLPANTVSKQIAVGINPEQMLLVNNRLYVANSGSNTISVITLATDAAAGTISVPDGPKNLVLDGSGNIWVLCSEYGGAQDYLVRFNPATPTQQTRISFPNHYSNGNLRTNGNGSRIYVSLGSGTYELSPTATTLPATPLIPRNFYGLGIDPQDGTIYAGTSSFSADGYMVRYTPAGALIDSTAVGIGPNSFLFY